MDTTYTFSFLKEQDIPELYDTFLRAFATYFVPIKLSREEFSMKLKREGVEPSFCAGAFHYRELVGFVLTGLGEWQGKPTAYNAGTGVLPEHRGHHLTQRLYEFMLPKLKASGIEQCLLEVIQENKTAIKAYEAIGFGQTRSLDCFRSPIKDLVFSGEETNQFMVKEVVRPNWQVYAEFCDISPTWQNTKQAFKQSPDSKKVLEAYFEDNLLVGYIAFFPRTGSIAQLAVRPGYRSRGIATSLLKEVVKQTKASALTLINVDTASPVMLEFLERCHFKRILGQREMLLPLY